MDKEILSVKKIVAFIVNWFWFQIYGEYTTAEKEKLYNDLADVRALEQFLLNHNFYWASDGLNACMTLDTFARPEQTLARGWGNCGDFMRLYEDFLKYKNKGRYVQYELTTPTTIFGFIPSKRWHYVMLINDEVVQTNVNLRPLVSLYFPDNLKMYFPEYQDSRIIDEWSAK